MNMIGCHEVLLGDRDLQHLTVFDTVDPWLLETAVQLSTREGPGSQSGARSKGGGEEHGSKGGGGGHRSSKSNANAKGKGKGGSMGGSKGGSSIAGGKGGSSIAGGKGGSSIAGSKGGSMGGSKGGSMGGGNGQGSSSRGRQGRAVTSATELLLSGHALLDSHAAFGPQDGTMLSKPSSMTILGASENQSDRQVADALWHELGIVSADGHELVLPKPDCWIAADDGTKIELNSNVRLAIIACLLTALPPACLPTL